LGLSWSIVIFLGFLGNYGFSHPFFVFDFGLTSHCFGCFWKFLKSIVQSEIQYFVEFDAKSFEYIYLCDLKPISVVGNSRPNLDFNNLRV